MNIIFRSGDRKKLRLGMPWFNEIGDYFIVLLYAVILAFYL